MPVWQVEFHPGTTRFLRAITRPQRKQDSQRMTIAINSGFNYRAVSGRPLGGRTHINGLTLPNNMGQCQKTVFQRTARTRGLYYMYGGL